MIKVQVTAGQLAEVPLGTACALARHTKELMAEGGIPVVVDHAPGFVFTKGGALHAEVSHDEITYCWEPEHA